MKGSRPGLGGEEWTAADIANMESQYGLAEWNPPDAGNAIQERQPSMFGFFDGLTTLDGGTPNNDGRYVSGESVLDFISRASVLGRPFCLFVSLVNPHDIGFFPDGWKDGGYRRSCFRHLCDLRVQRTWLQVFSQQTTFRASKRILRGSALIYRPTLSTISQPSPKFNARRALHSTSRHHSEI